MWFGEEASPNTTAAFWITLIGGICLALGAFITRMLTAWSKYRKEQTETDEKAAGQEYERGREERRAAITELRKLLQQERQERREAEERWDKNREAARGLLDELTDELKAMRMDQMKLWRGLTECQQQRVALAERVASLEGHPIRHKELSETMGDTLEHMAEETDRKSK